MPVQTAIIIYSLHYLLYYDPCAKTSAFIFSFADFTKEWFKELSRAISRVMSICIMQTRMIIFLE